MSRIPETFFWLSIILLSTTQISTLVIDTSGRVYSDLIHNTTGNFSSELTSWTKSGGKSPYYYTCNKTLIMSGYQIGGTYSRTFSNLPSHDMVALTFRIFSIDSWGTNDKLLITVGTKVLSLTGLVRGRVSNALNCGSNSRKDFGEIRARFLVFHNTTSLTVQFQPSMGSSAYYGIRDIKMVYGFKSNQDTEYSCYISTNGYTLTSKCNCTDPTKYYDRTTKTCVKCNSTCSMTCTDSPTSQCVECKTGYFYNGFMCVGCPPGCAVCNSSTYCLNCTTGLFKYSNGTCGVCAAPMNISGSNCVSICNSSSYLYWDRTCSNNCSSPLTVSYVGKDKLCLYTCTGNNFLFEDKSCSLLCNPPYSNYTFKTKNFCKNPCRGPGVYEYDNWTCGVNCNFPNIVFNMGSYNHCGIPCSGVTPYQYQNGSCLPTCNQPFGVQYFSGYPFCNFVCNLMEFLLVDSLYNCSSSCPAPFITTQVSLYRYCSTNCPGSYVMRDGKNCSATCASPWLPTITPYLACDTPCANQDDFLNPDGTCGPTCDFPMISQGAPYSECVSPCLDSEYYHYDTSSCVAVCDPPLTTENLEFVTICYGDLASLIDNSTNVTDILTANDTTATLPANDTTIPVDPSSNLTNASNNTNTTNVTNITNSGNQTNTSNSTPLNNSTTLNISSIATNQTSPSNLTNDTILSNATNETITSNSTNSTLLSNSTNITILSNLTNYSLPMNLTNESILSNSTNDTTIPVDPAANLTNTTNNTNTTNVTNITNSGNQTNSSNSTSLDNSTTLNLSSNATNQTSPSNLTNDTILSNTTNETIRSNSTNNTLLSNSTNLTISSNLTNYSYPMNLTNESILSNATNETAPSNSTNEFILSNSTNETSSSFGGNSTSIPNTTTPNDTSNITTLPNTTSNSTLPQDIISNLSQNSSLTPNSSYLPAESPKIDITPNISDSNITANNLLTGEIGNIEPSLSLVITKVLQTSATFAATTGGSAAVTSSMTATVFGMIPLNRFMYYIRFFKVDYPHDVKVYFAMMNNTEFLSFGYSLPVPGLKVNPDIFLPSNFKGWGFSANFFENYWKTISTVLITFLFAGLSIIVESATKKGYQDLIFLAENLKNMFKWNMALTIFCSGFDMITLFSSFELRNPANFDNGLSGASYLLCLVCIISQAGAILVIFKLTRGYYKSQFIIMPTSSKNCSPSEAFAFKWRSFRILFAGFNQDSYLTAGYLLFYLIRNIIWTVAVAFLYDSPMLQLGIICGLSVLTLAILIIKKPFLNIVSKYEMPILEIVSLFVHVNILLVFIMTEGKSASSETINLIGMLIIYGSTVFSILTFLSVGVHLIRSLITSVKIYRAMKRNGDVGIIKTIGIMFMDEAIYGDKQISKKQDTILSLKRLSSFATKSNLADRSSSQLPLNSFSQGVRDWKHRISRKIYTIGRTTQALDSSPNASTDNTPKGLLSHVGSSDMVEFKDSDNSPKTNFDNSPKSSFLDSPKNDLRPFRMRMKTFSAFMAQSISEKEAINKRKGSVDDMTIEKTTTDRGTNDKVKEQIEGEILKIVEL